LTVRTIEVDREVWDALSELAEPLVDTPNTVLRRVLLPGSRVHFARLRMKDRELIKTNSPRGTWEISEQGRQYLAEVDGSS
jgi:hypothetical protein